MWCPMSTSEQFYTADGGYVLLMEAGTVPGYPMRFACTAGDDDMGVALTTDEALRLGTWLLKQAVAEMHNGGASLLGEAIRKATVVANARDAT